MVKPISHFILLLALFLGLSQATTSVPHNPTLPEPQLHKSFKIHPKQVDAVTSVCSYSITIKTSCSSTSWTRDKVSLAFGDAFGNEVFAPRIDDPASRTFERCSTDTFQIKGPCMYDICYFYLLRVGSDGWKPESVGVFSPNRRPMTYTYNSFLPNGVWFGFNHCGRIPAVNSVEVL